MATIEGGRLAGCRVLIVEDEYLLASDFARLLASEGAEAVGPAGTLEEALQLIHAAERIDAAIVDLNLREEWAAPAADALAERNIPFVLATGYGAENVPDRLQQAPRWEKPFDPADLIQFLTRFV
ncbi:MAG TPA: response regulator [Alphaproteobacteria bacterium]|nr:response regulator [Alphaproteobacteria bacterium]